VFIAVTFKKKFQSGKVFPPRSTNATSVRGR
jgi:hypothetical protein